MSEQTPAIEIVRTTEPPLFACQRLEDGLLIVHPWDESCEVCAPVLAVVEVAVPIKDYTQRRV